MVTFSMSSPFLVTVGWFCGVWGLCEVCATVRLVSSAKLTRGEGRWQAAFAGYLCLMARPGVSSRGGTGEALPRVLSEPAVVI